MRNKIIKSFSVRLSLRFMFILSLAVIFLSLGVLFFLRTMVRMTQFQNLKNAEDQVFLAFSRDNENFKKESETLTPDIPYFITYIIYNSETQEVIATNDPFLPLLSDTKGKAKRYYQKDFFFDGDLDILYYSTRHENLVFAVAENIENNSFSMILKKLPLTLLLMIVPILFISFLLSLFITKNTINPVVKITKSAQNLTTENLDMILPVSKRQDEIDELSKTFNSLFMRIKADFDRERQFSNDVAHELNTPLTVISGQANLLLRWGKEDPLQLEKSLIAIKDESKSMHTIIENLLQISRIESGRISPQISKISIGEVFERIRNEVQAIAAQVSFDISISSGDINEKESDSVLYTDPEMLHQILTILISNSIKFAGDKCAIKLSFIKKNDFIIIREEDNGPGISEEALPHVFERFYRADEAHIRTAGGSGLGLSIAKTLCSAIGAQITAGNVVPNGALFEITLESQKK